MSTSRDDSPGEATPGPRDRRLSRNPILLCVHHALMMSLFPMAVLTVFQHEHLGLDIAEVMLVQAAFGGSLAIFEFPSGYLADRIGYRATLVAASLVSIAGWTLYTFASGFASVVIAEVAMGLGLSLVSGTNSAMLFESLANLGRDAEFARWFGRIRFFSQVSEGSAALVAGLLFAFSARLPFALMVVVWVVNLFVALALVEPRFDRRRVERPLAHVLSLVHFVARRAPRLRALFAVGVVLGLASFVPVWLVSLYARDGGVPLSWLGPIWATANYVVAFGSITSERLANRIGAHTVLFGCVAFVALGYFGMGASHAVWGFVFYFGFNLSRGFSAPILAHAEQNEIPSGDRASLVSLRSLLFRVGFIAIGPATGAAIDLYGQHAVLLALGCLFTSLGGVTTVWLSRIRSDSEADARLDSSPYPARS